MVLSYHPWVCHKIELPWLISGSCWKKTVGFLIRQVFAQTFNSHQIQSYEARVLTFVAKASAGNTLRFIYLFQAEMNCVILDFIKQDQRQLAIESSSLNKKK